jgi:hypothetical protein
VTAVRTASGTGMVVTGAFGFTLGMNSIRNLGCSLLVVGLPDQLLKVAPQRHAEAVFGDSGNFSFFDGRRSLSTRDCAYRDQTN